MQQLVELLGSHAQHGASRVDQAFVDHVGGDAHRRGGRALAGARLQQIESPALDGELDVLHVAEVILEPFLRVDAVPRTPPGAAWPFRRCSSGVRIPATTSSPCALIEELAVELLLARRRISRERHAGSGIVAEVAEHHRDDVHGGAEVFGDAVHAPVVDRLLERPRSPHRFDRAPQLRHRVHRELAARSAHGRATCTPRRDCEASTPSSSASVAAPVVRRLAESRCSNLREGHAEHDVAVHLDEATIGVVGEARIAARPREADHGAIVQPEVEDRLHHPRHRHRRAGSHRDEERHRRRRRTACRSTCSRRLSAASTSARSASGTCRSRR